MNFNMSQQLKTGQQLKLAPRIIQTMEIMQLPLPALEEKIEQELDSNIALELDEPENEDEIEIADDVEERTEDDLESEFSRLEEFEEQTGADLSDLPPSKPQIQHQDSKYDAMSNIRARHESLSEQLLHQWSFAEVSPEMKEIGTILIGEIDVDGFLTLTNSEMQETIRHESAEECSTELIESVIHALQKWLDPPGIAARSLQESLLIQVNEYASDDPEGWSDVAIVIETHLDDLIANRLPKVASATGIGIDRVKESIEKMHELTLSPGRLIATDRVLPVIPDAFIQFDDLQDRYVVGVSSGRIPPLKLSTQYQTISSNPSTDDSTKQFIQRNMNAARWIIEAVEQRKKTLHNIVQIVAKRQRDFLDQGDAYLRPLPMIEVADMLGIHVATVSRAVADKWIQTPRGLFPLRRFFSGGTATQTEGEMSWEAVKTRLHEIVEQEDKKKPLSDEAIARKLREQGITIARRTVVKYRQQLGLAAARFRKEF